MPKQERGPFLLTLDVILPDAAAYERVIETNVLQPETIAAAYGVDQRDVRVVPFALANAIKIVIPRLVSSGDVEDTDIYGAQQHVPLMNLELW